MTNEIFTLVFKRATFFCLVIAVLICDIEGILREHTKISSKLFLKHMKSFINFWRNGKLNEKKVI